MPYAIASNKEPSRDLGGGGGWQFFSEHLAHASIPPREAEFLWQLLTADATGSATRGEVVKYLVSGDGRAAWHGSERDLHRSMIGSASRELAELLRAIQSYEAFARLLTDAFESCLHSMTRTAGRTPPADLAAAAAPRRAAERLPAMCGSISDHLAPLGLARQFDESFAWTARATKPEQWVICLLDHHLEVQRNKPPHGKNPWVEVLPDGSYVIRTAYRRHDPPETSEEYVHAYRTEPLLSFARDLGMAPDAR